MRSTIVEQLEKRESIARHYRGRNRSDDNIIRLLRNYLTIWDDPDKPKTTFEVEQFLAGNVTIDVIVTSNLLPPSELTALLLRTAGFEYDGLYWYRKRNRLCTVVRRIRSFIPRWPSRQEADDQDNVWGPLDIKRPWQSATEEA